MKNRGDRERAERRQNEGNRGMKKERRQAQENAKKTGGGSVSSGVRRGSGETEKDE